MEDMKLRRMIQNKLSGLRYNVFIHRQGIIVVEAEDDSLERVKRNIMNRINNVTFIDERTNKRINWSKMNRHNGMPCMGREESKCIVLFKLEENV